MRVIVGVFLLFSIFVSQAVAQENSIVLNSGVFFVKQDGKNLALDKKMYVSSKVENADWVFLAVGSSLAKKYNLKDGIYIFSPAKQEAIHFIPTDDADFCAAMYASPKKDILAVDFGMSLQRELHFYSYPDLKKIGHTEYFMHDAYPVLFWKADGSGVAYASMKFEENEPRLCQYDPCGARSTKFYSFSNGKEVTLQEGTPLCDYWPTSLNGNTLEIASICLESVEAWSKAPLGPPTGSLTVQLP